MRSAFKVEAWKLFFFNILEINKVIKIDKIEKNFCFKLYFWIFY